MGIIKGQKRLESCIDKLAEDVAHLSMREIVDVAVLITTLRNGDISRCVKNISNLEKRQILAFHHVKSREIPKLTRESGIN